MTTEELILKRLEAIEAKIDPMIRQRRKWDELREDLIPLQHQAVNLIIEHLQEVEPGFQLDDLLLLLKQAMRNTHNFLFALKAFDSLIEFVLDMEPLLKSAVPKIIQHLDELEQKGVFRIIKSMLDVRAKVAAQYDHKDIEEIGDGLVALLSLAKKMSDPRTLAFLEKAAALPAQVDFSRAEKAGLFRLLSQGFNQDVQKGLGVLLELTKALAVMKDEERSE